MGERQNCRILRPVSRLGGDDRGSATVEFVIWLPFFFLIFGLMTDAVLLMQRQTQMFDVARTASRSVSLGLADTHAAADFVTATLPRSEHGQASVSIEGGLVTTSITVPYADVVLFGDILIGESALRASVTMVQEAVVDDASS